MTDPADVAVRLHEALEGAGVPHAIGGALAYGFHAEPRATSDIDLNLFVDAESLGRAFSALEGAGCRIDRAEAAARAASRGDFRGSMEGYRVDAFVSFHPFHESVRSRVQTGVLLGR